MIHHGVDCWRKCGSCQGLDSQEISIVEATQSNDTIESDITACTVLKLHACNRLCLVHLQREPGQA
jgi:hypothetical protein